MTYFLGVIFLCMNEQCMFWKTNELFFTEKDCAKTVAKAMKELDEKEVDNFGTCLQITTKNNT